jgi:HxlR-like helix-turn-helix
MSFAAAMTTFAASATRTVRKLAPSANFLSAARERRCGGVRNTANAPYHAHEVFAVAPILIGGDRRCLSCGGLPQSMTFFPDRLRELELEGVVERTVIPETPVRIDYTPTKKGSALAAAFQAIGEWAHKWDAPAAVSKQRRRA